MRTLAIIFFFILSCALISCDNPEIIAEDIKNSENAMFTEDGRLFVTNGPNLHEIIRNDDGEYISILQTGGDSCYFTGMVTHENYLYSIRINLKPGTPFGLNTLRNMMFSKDCYAMLKALRTDIVEEEAIIRAKLYNEDETPVDELQFETVYIFENTVIPNGLTVDGKGRLYITDETFLPCGKIVRVTPGQDSEPLYEEWLTHEDNKKLMQSPNGIKCMGNEIYYTNHQMFNLKTQIIKVVINEETGDILSKTVFYERSGVTFFDDFALETISGSNYLIAADILNGSVVFIDRESQEIVHESASQTISSPTAVILGRDSLSLSGNILVTTGSGKGLVRYPIPEGL